MDKARILGTRRMALLAILLILLGSTLFLIPPAEAQTSVVITTYYTDATKVTAVGQQGRDCDGNVISWGVTTPYYRFTVVTCPT